MAAAGHEVIVYCRRGHYRDRPKRFHGVRLRYLPALHQKHLETLSHTALSAMMVNRHHAIVCMGVGNAPVVRALELLGHRVIFNVDGADWQRPKWGRSARRYLRFCERLAAGGRSVIVADSRAIGRYYLENYHRATEFVPYGALPPADRGMDTISTLGLKSRAYTLFVGRLVPENAPHEFLEATRIASIPWPAVVVGDAPYARDYIDDLHRDAPGQAIFTGYRFGRAYQQISAHAGIFVLAATVGGTHPVLLEQMAAGNCILARDTPSNREVLGEAGLFWSTPEELARQIRELWQADDRRRELGRAAETRVSAHYNWDSIAARYTELCARTQ